MSLGLATYPGRCPDCEYHVATQGHGQECAPVAPADEWGTFVSALRQARRPDGTVHANDVRPLIASIYSKHRGQLYRRAKSDGLIRDTGMKEPSTDVAGRNSDKEARIYEWRAAA